MKSILKGWNKGQPYNPVVKDEIQKAINKK